MYCPVLGILFVYLFAEEKLQITVEVPCRYFRKKVITAPPYNAATK